MLLSAHIESVGVSRIQDFLNKPKDWSTTPMFFIPKEFDILRCFALNCILDPMQDNGTQNLGPEKKSNNLRYLLSNVSMI